MSIKNSKKYSGILAKITLVGIVFVLALSLIFPALHSSKAYAYGQITNREIEMSSSAAGATSVQYTFSFKAATTAKVEGIVFNFCDNDPIIGDSCTYTSGQSISLASATFTSITGTPDTTVGASNWQISTNSNNQTAGNGVILALTDSSATESGTNVASGTTITVVISGIVNPAYTSNTLCATAIQPNCSFYGRMLTYNTTTGATNYASAVIGAVTDAGGAALSTASQINITSKVQEELSFCVYSAASSGTCGNPPNVLLGNNNDVLSTAGPFVDENTQFDIQTNASQGATVNMSGNTLTANGIYTIAPLTTAAASSAGTSQFGLCDYEKAGGTTITPVVAYNGGAGHLCTTVTQTSGTASPGGAGTVVFYFGSNIEPANDLYGDPIANVVAGSTSTGIVAFMANIAITQTAGIYTTTLGLIADSTY
jgi:hypothetical protein